MFKTVLGKIHPSVFLKAAKAASSSISEHEKKLLEICRLSTEDALKNLEVTENGLTDDEVETAREEFGPNNLGSKKQTGVVMELLQRCRNPLVIQLLVICIISIATGDVPSAIVVGGMIFLSVVLAYVQEHRSSKAV